MDVHVSWKSSVRPETDVWCTACASRSVLSSVVENHHLFAQVAAPAREQQVSQHSWEEGPEWKQLRRDSFSHTAGSFAKLLRCLRR